MADKTTEDFFDSMGPTYDEVMRFGEKVYEKEIKGYIGQIWLYEGEKLAMVWDKVTGANLSYDDYESVAKRQYRLLFDDYRG